MSDNIIQLNEDLIKHDLKNLVRSSVEETLNDLLVKEADELVNAGKYKRSGERQGYRSGHYKRNFQTTAGEVGLNVPKLKGGHKDFANMQAPCETCARMKRNMTQEEFLRCI